MGAHSLRSLPPSHPEQLVSAPLGGVGVAQALARGRTCLDVWPRSPCSFQNSFQEDTEASPPERTGHCPGPSWAWHRGPGSDTGRPGQAFATAPTSLCPNVQRLLQVTSSF